jgi:hypothetical protein
MLRHTGRRDWPLFLAGLGIAVLSAAVAVPPVVAYRPEDPPCPRPEPPAVLIDGCSREPGGAGFWISQPGVIAFLAVSFVLLVVAVAVMWRALSPRGAA